MVHTGLSVCVKPVGDFWKRAYLITICVTVCGVILCLVVTAPCAYMLSKKDLFGRRVISFLLIFTMLFNGGMIASYVNYTQIFPSEKTRIWPILYRIW